MTEEISNHSIKIEELNNDIATLTQERDDSIASYNAANESVAAIQATLDETNATLATVTAERDGLVSYRKNIEDEEKRTVINGYSDQLPEEVIETYTNNMDNYTAEELDMKLTYELKRNHPELFSKNTPPAYIPKDEAPSGLNAILAKYKK
jgi:uncharacterized coiled-coil DUF342 family protein